MNLTDDLLRSALHETASEIPADRIRAFDAAVVRDASGASQHVIFPRSRWLTAAAAAAAVVAVIVGSAVLAAGPSSRPHSPNSASSPYSPTVSTGTVGPLPRYYAVISSAYSQYRLIIRSARAGTTLATARLTGHLSNSFLITAAANGTTFVIGKSNTNAAGSLVSMSFLLARFDPARKRITLRTLPIAPLASADFVQAIALSPDGSKLAVAAEASHDGAVVASEIRVYAVATGGARVWTEPGGSQYSVLALSWGPGAILGLDYFTSRPTVWGGIRLLNTDRAAGNLLPASRLTVPQIQPAGYKVAGQFTLIDHGTAVVTDVQRLARRKVNSQFEVLSTSTGRVIRAFFPSTLPGGEEGLMWSNSAGTVFAGYVPYTGPHPNWLGPVEWFSTTAHMPIKGVPNESLLGIAF
jgi:hypothetical protein